MPRRTISASLLAAGLLAIGPPALAISINESTIPGGNFGLGSYDIGNLTIGANSVIGSLSGSCDIVNCNSAPGGASGNSQDNFILHVATGTLLDVLTVTTSSVSGPTGFSASFFFNVPSPGTDIFVASLPLGSTTADLVAAVLSEGTYSVAIYGQQASATGPFSFNYQVNFNVTAVPVPPVAWMLAPAIAAVLPWMKRRRAVS